MKTATVIETATGQAVCLPDEFRFDTDRVAIRREGNAIVLESPKPAHWPEGFFAAIAINDPAFARPLQGSAPPPPRFP